MRSLAMIAALVLYATALRAAPVMTYGVGAGTSCGTWLDHRQRGEWFDMGNWALGFISGAGIYGNVVNPLGKTDADGVLYWLDNYCRRDPSGYFSEAVKAFINAHAQ